MDFQRPFAVVTPTLDGDILAVLSRADQELTGRQVHQLVPRGSEQGVRRALTRLVEQGVVLRRAAGRAQLHCLNREHLAASHVEGLADMRGELIARLRGRISEWRLQPAAAVLFGSVARGDADTRSDVDLLVVRSTKVDEDDLGWRRQLDGLAAATTAWTGNDARVLELDEGEIGSDDEDPVVIEALADGVDLAGSRRPIRRLVMGR